MANTPKAASQLLMLIMICLLTITIGLPRLREREELIFGIEPQLLGTVLSGLLLTVMVVSCAWMIKLAVAAKKAKQPNAE